MPRSVAKKKRQRWRSGNEDEKGFWLGLKEEDFLAHERGYRALAGQMMERLPWHDIREDYRALQIGCAVEDVVFFLTGGERYAIDPLASFYKEHFERANNPEVDYRERVGEALPFPDAFFDLVICQNVLDHVADYHVVLEEVRRVLRQPNLVYFGTDVYEESDAEVRWERSARGEIFDIQHPHTFTERTIDATLRQHQFEIIERYPRQPSGKGDESWRYCLYGKGVR